MNILNQPIYIGFFQLILSLLIISGIILFGKFISSYFFKKFNNSLINLLIGFSIITQLFKIFVYLDLFNEVKILFSLLIIVFGIYNLKSFIYSYKKIYYFNKLNLFEISSIILLIFLLINSVSPPTMADALDYHYGVPLYLINNLTLPQYYFWLWGSAAIGNSDIFNALPIYYGIDNFVSILQFCSLFLFLLFIKNKIKDRTKFVFFTFFILSSPVILQLLSGPKFTLFPQLMTATAIYLFVQSKKIEIEEYILICILLMGATQFRSSFLISGSIIGFLTFYSSIKINTIKTILVTIFLFIFFLIPTSIWNFTQVDEFKILNIISLIPPEMMETLKLWKENYYPYPLNLFIPSSLGKISTIIGFQIILLLLVFNKSEKSNKILFITAFTIFLHFLFGMNVGRLYFEYILWTSLCFIFVKSKKINYNFLQKLLFPQLLFVLILAGYYSVVTLPSIFSNKERDKFMSNNSFEYEIIKWVNNEIPSDGKIISGLRSVAFLKNDYIPTDWLNLGINNKISSEGLQNYLSIIKEKKFNFIILYEGAIENHPLKKCISEKFTSSNEFLRATRNPLNRNKAQKIEIYNFNFSKLPYCVN